MSFDVILVIGHNKIEDAEAILQTDGSKEVMAYSGGIVALRDGGHSNGLKEGASKEILFDGSFYGCRLLGLKKADV